MDRTTLGVRAMVLRLMLWFRVRLAPRSPLRVASAEQQRVCLLPSVVNTCAMQCPLVASTLSYSAVCPIVIIMLKMSAARLFWLGACAVDASALAVLYMAVVSRRYECVTLQAAIASPAGALRLVTSCIGVATACIALAHLLLF